MTNLKKVTMGLTGSNLKGLSTKECLCLSYDIVSKAVLCYHEYHIPPVVDYEGFKFFAVLVLGKTTDQVTALKILQLWWSVFSDGVLCSIQELLVALVLSCEVEGRNKCALLYDIFKCMNGEEIGYDDIVMGTEVVIITLFKLWEYGGNSSTDQPDRWTADKVRSITESFTDRTMNQLGKEEMDELITREEFLRWAIVRFTKAGDNKEHELIIVHSLKTLEILLNGGHVYEEAVPVDNVDDSVVLNEKMGIRDHDYNEEDASSPF